MGSQTSFPKLMHFALTQTPSTMSPKALLVFPELYFYFYTRPINLVSEMQVAFSLLRTACTIFMTRVSPSLTPCWQRVWIGLTGWCWSLQQSCKVEVNQSQPRSWAAFMHTLWALVCTERTILKVRLKSGSLTDMAISQSQTFFIMQLKINFFQTFCKTGTATLPSEPPSDRRTIGGTTPASRTRFSSKSFSPKSRRCSSSKWFAWIRPYASSWEEGQPPELP